MNIADISKLVFFKADEYCYQNTHICDFSGIPRPHFCMGLLERGTGTFHVHGENDITVHENEIIFVPITSRYISTWNGNPNVRYTSLHFAFAPSFGISEKERFRLQKITPPDPAAMQADYRYIFEHQNSDELSMQYAVLSRFYAVLSAVSPFLAQNSESPHDERIDAAAEFIDRNSENNLSIALLAENCRMSISNFYLLFKKYKGMTPIDYRNHARISRAMRLLKSDRQLSVEELSRLLGFESATYFRRTFKKIVGISPRAYRENDMEL